MSEPNEHVYRRTIDLDSGDSLALIAKQIRKNTTVLELGPATGYFSQFLKDELGCMVDGVELSGQMATEARPWFRKLLVGDIESIELKEEFQISGYDYIVCADILEHLRSPEVLVQRLGEFLSAAGELIVSVPNIAYGGVILELLEGDFRYRPEGLLDQTHLRFFTRESFSRVLQNAGLEIIAIEPVNLLYEHSEFRDVIARARNPMKDWVLGAKDRDVYQYIFRARVATGVG